MKANFALTLSFTGIRLLHRAAGGWRFVGDVALDDPDLDGALAALRKTALELEPSGLRTKLVIPGTQIRYLTIDTEGMFADQLHKAAEAALDGATPYSVSDLVFDLSPDGNKTHIAAAARETVAEAEAFAVKHRFAPISAVAIPETEDFLGEPFFGATEHAAELLGPGEQVEPDGIAIVELGPQEWPDGPVVDVSDTSPVAEAEPAAPMPPAAARDAARDAGEPDADAAPAVPEQAAAQPQVTEGTPADDQHPAEDEDQNAPDAAEETSAPPSVGFASRRRPGSDGAPKLGGVSRRFDPAPAPPAETAEPAPATTADAREPDIEAPKFEPLPEEHDVPDPPPAALAAFLSRRQAQSAETSQDGPKEPDASKPEAEPAGPAPSGPKAQPDSSAEAPDVPPLAVAARQPRPEIRPVRVPRPQTERQRMTVFGARQPEADGAAAVGGKPRFLGLILTAMLLLFLAGVAAWAAVFVEDGLARFFAPRQPEAPVTAEELAPEPAPQRETAPAPEITESTEPRTTDTEDLQTAALDTALPPNADAPEPDALAEPAPPPAFDREEAEAQYAVTGIWTVPPEVPEAPGLVNLDDLYMTSIDPANLSFDAVALRPEPEVRTDRAPLAPSDPAPPGTEFDLDGRGLVIPTPDGAMSPDGILVHSGPPPVVPPETPERAEEVPEDVDAAVRQELGGFRPRVRPDDLVENTERRQLGGLSRSELAGYRPKLRPDSVKQAEEEDETPTARAVASSLRPSNRPRNFDRIVARAVQRNLSPVTGAADDDAQEVASTAPRAVAPAIPSRSSVTQEATVRNALNLRRINLMGVYGSPSNRRALVRLSNGRYKKVKVGDRIDGGRVSAIGESELSYVKGNRNFVLKMPRT